MVAAAASRRAIEGENTGGYSQQRAIRKVLISYIEMTSAAANRRKK